MSSSTYLTVSTLIFGSLSCNNEINVIGPNLPIYIATHNNAFENVVSSWVIPIDKPVVEKAENTSNKTLWNSNLLFSIESITVVIIKINNKFLFH